MTGSEQKDLTFESLETIVAMDVIAIIIDKYYKCYKCLEIMRTEFEKDFFSFL